MPAWNMIAGIAGRSGADLRLIRAGRGAELTRRSAVMFWGVVVDASFSAYCHVFEKIPC